MDRVENINSLKVLLQQSGIQGMIIPTNDPHFSEYTQKHFSVREWLSGFDGSAGTLVVTLEASALWTDSRYFVKAASDLKGSNIKLMKIKMPDTPSIPEWINSLYPNGASIAIDESLFSYSEYISLKKELEPSCIKLISDPFDNIWEERPKIQFNNIRIVNSKYSGEESYSKLERITNKIYSSCKIQGNFAYIVSACDEVAWLCNIRGNDIEYNQIPQSYAIITHNAIHLFVDSSVVNNEIINHLHKNKIELHNYNTFNDTLKGLKGERVICSPNKITVKDFKTIQESGANIIYDPIPGGLVNYMKSIKNEYEISGFKLAYKEDGIAWCRLLKFIEDSLKTNKILTEYEIGNKLIELRKTCPDYLEESFEPIIAFGQNAALPHYSASKNNTGFIENDNFLLMDTGAQYIYGTTDTTRTIPIGNVSEEQKKYYTLVLKGMVDLTLAKFPKNTRGSQLDILARGPLFNEAVMYFHGTGHGIGHNLCVHEGPQSIRMEENPVTLEPGMVISNEPAIYFEGKYGIRTENTILVKEWTRNNFNEFYCFETLTLVPIATSCIDKSLLSPQEINWIKNYNNYVLESLQVNLTETEINWLKEYISF